MKVLVVAAHPDDEILGVGGTIRRHSLAGDEVRVLIACEGISMRYDAADRERVDRESTRAAEILGVSELTFGGLPDQKLDTLPQVEVTSEIEKIIDAFRPEAVYTHFPGDVNHDHRVLFEAVQVATRPYSAPFVRELLVFETPSSTEWGFPELRGTFTPGLFVDIGDTLEAKVEAFCCYQKEVREQPHPRSPEALRARAITWGSHVGLAAAEPFQIVRSLR